MTIFVLALVVLSLYLAITVVCQLMLGRYARDEVPRLPEEQLPALSIVVAARDEEHDIEACLRQLQAQCYPADRLQIIVANDASSDRTAEIARRLAAEDPRICVLDVPQKGPLSGKACALHHAFAHADGEIFLTTDADCRPAPEWARHYAEHFADEKLGLLAGITVVTDGSLFAEIQRADWYLLLGYAAASSLLGQTVTGMGNNMALRREAYEMTGGYPELPESVTEDYELVRGVRERTDFEARLAPLPGLVNRTQPVPTLSAFVRQRKRWARGGMGSELTVYLIYALIWIAHASALGLTLTYPFAGLAVLIAKAVSERGLAQTLGRITGTEAPSRWSTWLLHQAVLVLYVITIPILLVLRPKIQWKAREHA